MATRSCRPQVDIHHERLDAEKHPFARRAPIRCGLAFCVKTIMARAINSVMTATIQGETGVLCLAKNGELAIALLDYSGTKEGKMQLAQGLAGRLSCSVRG
jgi:hypothetical protein